MFCEIAGAILILAACGKEAHKPIFMRVFRTMYQKEPQKTRVGRVECQNRLQASGSSPQDRRTHESSVVGFWPCAFLPHRWVQGRPDL